MNITRIFLSVLLLFLFNNLFSQWTIQGKWSIGGEWVTIATLQESGNKRSAIIKAQGTYLAFKFNQSSSWYGDNLVTSSTYSGTYEYWYGNVGISEGDATISSGITNGDYYLIAWNGDNSDFWTLEHIENVSCVVKKDVGGSPTEETIALTQNTVDTQNWFKNSAMTVSTSNQKWQFKFLPNGQENSNFNQGGGFLIKIVDFWNLSSPGYIANGQDHWIEWNNIPTGTYNIAVQLTGTSNAYEITTSDLSLPVQLTSFTAEAENGSVLLTWQTATELNNYGFEIERSLSDATDWQKIGFVPGSGNSYSPKQYSFVDENPPSAKISYRLKQIDFDGQFEYYGIIAEVDASALTGVEDKGIPVQYSLSQNYPNPFNPSTKINYSIPGTENVSVIIYDLVGNEIRTLVNETKSAGNYEIEFDASYLASGVYYYKLKTSNFVQVRKMVLIK